MNLQVSPEALSWGAVARELAELEGLLEIRRPQFESAGLLQGGFRV